MNKHRKQKFYAHHRMRKLPTICVNCETPTPEQQHPRFRHHGGSFYCAKCLARSTRKERRAAFRNNTTF